MSKRTGLAHTVARLYYEGDFADRHRSAAAYLDRDRVSAPARGSRVRDRDNQGPRTFRHDEYRRAALWRTWSPASFDCAGSRRRPTLRSSRNRSDESLEIEPRSGAALAIGWGQTIWDILGVGLPPMPGVLVVPASGGMQEPSAHFQTNELVRLAAMQTGGSARFLHAPYLPSALLREQLSSDPDVMAGMSLWD